MTILTDARSAMLGKDRDLVDSLAVIALTLSIALALLGLVLTAHSSPDAQTPEAAISLIGP